MGEFTPPSTDREKRAMFDAIWRRNAGKCSSCGMPEGKCVSTCSDLIFTRKYLLVDGRVPS